MALTRPTSTQLQNSPALDLTMDEYADAIDALGLSVKSYGALGDGSNQTTAINNTITDATGEVYFPPGTYVVDPATLTEKSNVRWRGAGMYASVIKLKNSGNGKLLNWGASGPLAGISFVDLGFDGNMVNQTNGATRDDRSGRRRWEQPEHRDRGQRDPPGRSVAVARHPGRLDRAGEHPQERGGAEPPARPSGHRHGDRQQPRAQGQHAGGRECWRPDRHLWRRHRPHDGEQQVLHRRHHADLRDHPGDRSGTRQYGGSGQHRDLQPGR